MIYSAPFDVSTLGTVTLATNGETDVVLDLGALTNADSDSAQSSIFWHSNFATAVVEAVQTDTVRGIFRKISVNTFQTAAQTAIRLLMTTATWTTPALFTLTWMSSDPHNTVPGYQFAWPVANFSITFSNAATRSLFGFSGNVSGAQTYTGTQTPTYALVPTLTAGSDPTPEYEPESIANHISTDEAADGFGLSRTSSSLFQDWVQQFETKAKTFKRNATSTHPWTFQHLFEYCRGEYPFAAFDPGFGDGGNKAFFLRSEGAQFAPQRHSPGNDSQFFIPFRTEVGGDFAVTV